MSLLGHFGLTSQPFGVTPDPRFMYPSATHREALASLLHGIATDRGFTALIAEPGMGKTTLLFHLLQTLNERAKTAFLFQTLCGPQEFLAALLADLGIEDDGDSITSMQSKLNEYLLQAGRAGKQVVVIIDEAQNLDDQVLEVVRMLSNFETANRKLMHVVLAGQPQLAKKLARENLTQLRQRISIVARLGRFSAGETHEYMEHRLRVAGRQPSCGPLFTKQAYAMIAEHSQGIPRNINNLCFNAMSLACALKKPVVDDAMVQETVRDLELNTIAPPPRVEKSQGDSDEGRGRQFNLTAFSSALWRSVTVAAALVSLLCLGFVSGKALGERTARTSLQKPAENAPVLPAATALVPVATGLPGVGLKEINEGRQAGARFEAPRIAVGSGARRRSHTRRGQGAVALNAASRAAWSTKLSKPLPPPRIAGASRTEPGSPELQLAPEQASVPSAFPGQGEKP